MVCEGAVEPHQTQTAPLTAPQDGCRPPAYHSIWDSGSSCDAKKECLSTDEYLCLYSFFSLTLQRWSSRLRILVTYVPTPPALGVWTEAASARSTNTSFKSLWIRAPPAKHPPSPSNGSQRLTGLNILFSRYTVELCYAHTFSVLPSTLSVKFCMFGYYFVVSTCYTWYLLSLTRLLDNKKSVFPAFLKAIFSCHINSTLMRSPTPTFLHLHTNQYAVQTEWRKYNKVPRN